MGELWSIWVSIVIIVEKSFMMGLYNINNICFVHCMWTMESYLSLEKSLTLNEIMWCIIYHIVNWKRSSQLCCIIFVSKQIEYLCNSYSDHETVSKWPERNVHHLKSTFSSMILTKQDQEKCLIRYSTSKSKPSISHIHYHLPYTTQKSKSPVGSCYALSACTTLVSLQRLAIYLALP